jgi:chromosome segregation ATPase
LNYDEDLNLFLKGARMKLLLALIISVFSLSVFAQPDFDLSGSKVNAKICKSIESEIQSLSKQIVVAQSELRKLQGSPKPDFKAIKKLELRIEELKKRLAALSAFYEKHCKKDVVDCDQLKLKIASLEKELIAKKDQLTRLHQELRDAEKAGNKIKIAILKKRIAQIEKELSQLSDALNKLRDLYKKNC